VSFLAADEVCFERSRSLFWLHMRHVLRDLGLLTLSVCQVDAGALRTKSALQATLVDGEYKNPRKAQNTVHEKSQKSEALDSLNF
jgi:hypothetical protein